MSQAYHLVWTANALEDLLEIIAYIKEDNPDAAERVYRSIREKAESSSFFPLKGRVVPELEREGITLYREIVAPPWRIIYRIMDERVYVMAIVDSRRNLEDLLLRKLLKK
ncbi:type II toxin-antitoxin system RelE/ParE family toxin [Nitratifractor salsuginis]|uniref:Plasmid stabilization system n=1 Tax=Nitratifractor salsuginis (strain DSM 16511 / JCM 12458 / E9I37-1) TaxID=749222 RepID=E6X246_NITSE|nr:type II toxin-antitoxin system RelE/ParE family toxin [Nitratifractor salsuginis]ADV47115.1 plasmid stabilization system [Nitratifractor salsuginis DSM 16511]